MDLPDGKIYGCRFCNYYRTEDVYERPRHERTCVSNTRVRRKQKRKDHELCGLAGAAVDDQTVEENATDKAVEEKATDKTGETRWKGNKFLPTVFQRSRLNGLLVVKQHETSRLILWTMMILRPQDVKIAVKPVDRNGIFLGSMWESVSGINVGVILLEAGLARLQTGFGSVRLTDSHLLAQAKESAKKHKLKLWDELIGHHDKKTV